MSFTSSLSCGKVTPSSDIRSSASQGSDPPASKTHAGTARGNAATPLADGSNCCHRRQ